MVPLCLKKEEVTMTTKKDKEWDAWIPFTEKGLDVLQVECDAKTLYANRSNGLSEWKDHDIIPDLIREVKGCRALLKSFTK